MTTPKTCSRCGAAFGCGRDDAHCWCQDLPHLPRTTLDAAADCLCPDCLAGLARRTANAGTTDDAAPAAADPAD